MPGLGISSVVSLGVNRGQSIMPERVVTGPGAGTGEPQGLLLVLTKN